MKALYLTLGSIGRSSVSQCDKLDWTRHTQESIWYILISTASLTVESMEFYGISDVFVAYMDMGLSHTPKATDRPRVGLLGLASWLLSSLGHGRSLLHSCGLYMLRGRGGGFKGTSSSEFSILFS